MEDSLVIYRLARAPERRIFYIDVGNLPKGKSEEYMKGIMAKYRNKLVYDASTGAIKDDRKQLVGLLTDNPNEILEEGAQIVANVNKSPIEMLGHVTSSYYSPNLKKSIALGVVRGGKNMMGKKLIIPMENKTINVTVADPVFLDKENKRLNA